MEPPKPKVEKPRVQVTNPKGRAGAGHPSQGGKYLPDEDESGEKACSPADEAKPAT